MQKNFITFHIIRDIPWSNLNRDDTGTPKRTILGGVERGLLSSQSIKRAIRRDYEQRVLETFPDDKIVLPGSAEQVALSGSLRTRNADDYIAGRVKEILLNNNNENLYAEKNVYKTVNAILKQLTGGGAKGTKEDKKENNNKKDTVVLLSIEELETLASLIVQDLEKSEADKEKEETLIQKTFKKNSTGALAIAAFGRMFANASDKQTEASIAVSPAISTHGNLIETDYFIAGDDYNLNTSGAGAAHLGTALYTSGVFYHSVTIDVKELTSTWTGITGENASKHLSQLVRSIIRSLPSGKKNSTAPYTEPVLVIAEQQGYREAYSISEPVQMSEEGGFIDSTISYFMNHYDVVRNTGISNYGPALISGVKRKEFMPKNDFNSVDEEEMISSVVSWILDQGKKPVQQDRQLSQEKEV